jgi:hypothetical protein
MPTIADQQSFRMNREWTSARWERIAVSNARRRDLLRCLGQFVYPVELRTLATHTVAAQNDLSIDAVEADATERMAIRLHHLDIPVLSTIGLLAYDTKSRLVVYTAMTSWTDTRVEAEVNHETA